MDATTSDIPREVADIIIDLNIIARIPTNHKLNILTKTYVDADSKIDALWRTWYGETGDTTVDFINTTLDRAIDVCRRNPSWIDHIVGYVCNVSNALLNLEQIYKRKKQESTVGKLDLIKIRVSKDRFIRACKTPRSSSSISIPIPASMPLPIVSTTSVSMNPTVHTGLSPLFVPQVANTAPSVLQLSDSSSNKYDLKPEPEPESELEPGQKSLNSIHADE